ncbi:MAG TPA: hypothetical protein VIJ22_13900 [Polyangiaceae bacterium]
MKRRAFALSVACALVPAALLTSGAAAAQIDPNPTPDEEPPEPAPNEPKPDAPGASHGVARLALVGGYRRLYDLEGLGGGVQLSYGSDAPVSGHVNFRMLEGRTLGGLNLFEVSTTGTVEFALSLGFRFGFGGGVAAFAVTRATNGNPILSVGLEGIFRLGYDFAPHHALFILADIDVEWQTGPSAVWGPTLAVGYRF